jgi:hypothetical protein
MQPFYFGYALVCGALGVLLLGAYYIVPPSAPTVPPSAPTVPPSAPAQDMSTCTTIERPAHSSYDHTLSPHSHVWLSSSGVRQVRLTGVYLVDIDQHEQVDQVVPSFGSQPFWAYHNTSTHTQVLTFGFDSARALYLCEDDPEKPLYTDSEG